MGQPGFGSALDTPRTNIGDATYLSQRPDFADISQEASFQSPSKDGNFLHQLRHGRSAGVNLRTPRRREALLDRRNMPASIGGAEFTPLLKSATRNSVRRRGKENGTAVPPTPMGRIDEDDMTALPPMDTSIYTGSGHQSYMDQTLPHVNSSSAASTPMALPPRREGDKGPLNDGNQLSLREQENVIDRIEKENFGLKLKIHFLEEALRKAGPGFSEAALKENTELKVDKVTMQRELHRYKKHLTTAEKDLDSYRQHVVEIQEKAKRKYADESQRAEMDKLRQALEEREADIDNLQQRLDQEGKDNDQAEKLQDDIGDLEADLREKEGIITNHEDALEDLKDKLNEAEELAKDYQRKMIEIEEQGQQNNELETAKDTIQDLEHDVRRLEEQLDAMKDSVEEATDQKRRAEADLEELQEEMADKSMVTKGLSRQVEEKIARLQEELETAQGDYSDLERQIAEVNQDNERLQTTADQLKSERQTFDSERQSTALHIQEVETELLGLADDKDLLQSRHDTLTTESRHLQSEATQLRTDVKRLEKSLSEEREHATDIEKDLRAQYQDEIERLNDEITDLQAEVREKDNLYDNDSEKWETEKQTLESERERAEERANGLQRTIDRLRDAEGSLTDKESRLQEAMRSEVERHKSEEGVLTRQVDDLQDALETRQTLLTSLRNELSAVRDELRQTQTEYQTQANKLAAVEDEIDALQSNKGRDSTAERQELVAARRELRQTQTDYQAQADKLAALEDEIEALQSNKGRDPAAERQELVAARRELRQTQADYQTQADKLAILEDEVEAMHSHKVQDSAAERQELATARRECAALKEQIASLRQKEAQISRNSHPVEAQRSTTPPSDSQEELNSAHRTIRELQRRVEDYQDQLTAAAADGVGQSDRSIELSIVRKDLSHARQKEVEYAQGEAAHRDVVKASKRQIADLERQLHDNEMQRLIESPGSPSQSSIRKNEVSELRHKLSVAQQSLSELRSKNRAAEHDTLLATADLQRQLEDVEDQKIVLEEVLDEARQQAEESAIEHERALNRMKLKLDKAQSDRQATKLLNNDGDSRDRQLRKTQEEIDNLEHDILQQQQMMESLTASEGSLRRKLERARSERAAYRISAEKLQKDIRRLQTSAANVAKASPKQDATGEALETVIRAAESAEERHKKELRGMVIQMEWMQARWEREASLRADAGFAKKFVQLQLDIANACNKAQLRELEQIRTQLIGSRKPLVITSSSTEEQNRKPTLRTFLVMGRFIARMRLSADAWAKQEVVRQKLVAKKEEQRKVKRSRGLKVVRVET